MARGGVISYIRRIERDAGVLWRRERERCVYGRGRGAWLGRWKGTRFEVLTMGVGW